MARKLLYLVAGVVVLIIAVLLALRIWADDLTEIAMVPKNVVKLEQAEAQKVLKLIDVLEELDDVSKVFTNLDFDALELEEADA